jgi:LysR family nitrogen assimilation transcriptional regulator
MRFQDLEAFVEIVECGSLTEAARALDISQPALSRILRDLESSMGARLLARTGRGIELLPAGERFLDFARTTLDGLGAARGDIAALAPGAMEPLRISVPMGVAYLIAPPIVRAFALRLPALNVDVFEERTSQLSDAALQRRYDMSLAFTFDGETGEGQPLFIEAMAAIGRADLVGPDAVPISLADAADLPLMLPPMTRFRAMVNAAFARIGRTPHVARELESSGAMLAFAMEREGVAILPYSNLAGMVERDALSVRPIVDPPITRILKLLTRERSPRGRAREARDLLVETLRAQADSAGWLPLDADPRLS